MWKAPFDISARCMFVCLCVYVIKPKIKYPKPLLRYVLPIAIGFVLRISF